MYITVSGSLQRIFPCFLLVTKLANRLHKTENPTHGSGWLYFNYDLNETPLLSESHQRQLVDRSISIFVFGAKVNYPPTAVGGITSARRACIGCK